MSATNEPADIYEADDWLLLQGLEPERIAALSRQAQKTGNWSEVVPGIDSLALKFDPATTDGTAALQTARTLAQHRSDSGQTPSEPARLSICYDAAFGPDQALVAEQLGIDVADLPDWHMAQKWRVVMLGFLPGFAYLRAAKTLDIAIPRLESPRQKVPRGSVGLLGDQTGLYPMESPGGWPLIARIAEPLFRADSDRPFLLEPGQAIRFERVDRTNFEPLAAKATAP